MAKKELSKKEQLKQNRKKLAEELSGMHIYKDNHNRYVYYDIFTKNGYVISNVPSYRNYANRFILAAVVGILVYTFDFGKWTLPFALGAALLVWAVMEYKFRAFLRHQTLIMNFQPKERPPRILTAASSEGKKIVLKIVLYIMFAGLIIALPFADKSNTDTTRVVICVAIGIIALGMACYQGYALSYKKKHNIEDRY